MKSMQIRKEEVKLSLFADDIIYRKTLMTPQKNDRINSVADTKSIYKNQLFP